MAKSKLFHKNKLEPKYGTIVEVPSLKKWKRVVKTMPLKDLISLKLKTVEQIRDLSGTLMGKHQTKEKVQDTVEKIEGLQYNLNVFKQINAIANVGNPSADMYGINACIFQSSDLNGMNTLLSRLVTKLTLEEKKENRSDIVNYLVNKIDDNKEIVELLRKTQSDYNKKIKVTVEYLDVNLNAYEEKTES